MMQILPLLVAATLGIVLVLLCINAPASLSIYNESEGERSVKGQYRGDAGEYASTFFYVFFLSILTLGIYSPWGTVKLKKMLLAKTFVGEKNFDYHAKPVSILKGRILAIAILALLAILNSIDTTSYSIASIALILLSPGLIHIGWKSSYMNHSFDGGRFEYSGSMLGTYKAVYGLVFGTILSLTLAAPIFTRYFRAQSINSARWDNRLIGSNTTIGSFYAAYLECIFIFIFGILIALGLMALVEVPVSFGMLLVYLALLISISVYRWMTLNLVLNSTCVNDYGKIYCNLTTADILKLVIKNHVLIALTLGIYYPWARVRSHQLLVESVSIVYKISESEERPPNTTSKSAIADEMATIIFDVSA